MQDRGQLCWLPLEDIVHATPTPSLLKVLSKFLKSMRKRVSSVAQELGHLPS
jgi:hypothetical protein